MKYTFKNLQTGRELEGEVELAMRHYIDVVPWVRAYFRAVFPADAVGYIWWGSKEVAPWAHVLNDPTKVLGTMHCAFGGGRSVVFGYVSNARHMAPFKRDVERGTVSS